MPNKKKEIKSNKPYKIPDPKKIIQKLSNFVYGQNEAKKVLALASQNIGIRINYPELELKKTNVLLIGPTGSGKTYLVDTL